jgi:hypothetical protein
MTFGPRCLYAGKGLQDPPITRFEHGSANDAPWHISHQLLDNFINSLNGTVRVHLPQSFSASRFTASHAGFFILSQSFERPER